MVYKVFRAPWPGRLSAYQKPSAESKHSASIATQAGLSYHPDVKDAKKKTGTGKSLWSSGIYPLGVIYCAIGPRGVIALWISPVLDDGAFVKRLVKAGYAPVRDDAALKKAFGWLDRYFAGLSSPFPLPLDPHGTEFQKAVWKAVSTIPRGEVRSYSSIAAAIGRPKAARAIGGACAANPIPVIVPCHRVTSVSGEGGYTGGLHIKRALLRLEGVKD